MKNILAIGLATGFAILMYAGCYLLALERYGMRNENNEMDCRILGIGCEYRYFDPAAQWLFWPANQVDRLIAPSRWNPKTIFPLGLNDLATPRWGCSLTCAPSSQAGGLG